MKRLCVLVMVICFTQHSVRCELTKRSTYEYEPTWESLDARPVPDWYDDAKFGIFMHWGVYSVPSFGSEWFWINWRSGQKPYVDFMERLYPPGYSYQSFAPEFKAEFFDADKWADILQGSGAKYVVLTSKHHEGFTLWPSKRSYSWNSVDVGPHRDLVLELSQAVRKKDDMHFGVYYSLFEWYNPLYLADQANNFETRNYVDEKMLPELVEMIETYKPDVIWSDGDWEAKETYWRSRDFLAWLFNESPVNSTVVVNDRWGSEMPCHHGGVYTCTDRYNPQTLQTHKWENCMTVDKESWGYRRDAPLSDYLTVKELIHQLVTTVSCGGNLLMNVGPTKEGTIAPIFQDRLQAMGQWLQINGEAIYKTKPWTKQNDTINGDVWYTASKQQYLNKLKWVKNELDVVSTVYAIVLEWPSNRVLHVKDLANQLSADDSKVYLLGNEETPLKWTQSGDGVDISFPEMDEVKSQWAWSLKITNVNS